MNPRRTLALLALAAGAPLLAQGPATTPQPVPHVVTEIDLPLLLDLPGDLVFVRYTPGTLDRSASVQRRFEIVSKEFSRTGFYATSLVFYVLSRDDWNEAKIREPYGEPLAYGLEAIAVPGTADAALVASYREKLGGELPHTEGRPLLMSPEEGAALGVSDVLTQLEATRILARRAHMSGDAPWIEPLAVHLAARLTWDKYEPGRYPSVVAVLDRLATGDRGGHRLADWRDGLPLAERAWFDARFARGADVLARKSRAGKLWKMLNDGVLRSKPLTEAMLLEKFPELAAWKTENFAP